MAIASVRYSGNVEIMEDYQNLLEIFPRSTRLMESSQGLGVNFKMLNTGRSEM